MAASLPVVQVQLRLLGSQVPERRLEDLSNRERPLRRLASFPPPAAACATKAQGILGTVTLVVDPVLLTRTKQVTSGMLGGDNERSELYRP